MKNIVKIFTRDIKNIFTNWVAALVVIVIMIIPSLYSLINIYGSWDPYSSTGGVKVAVINEDKGTVFKDHGINLGDELVDKLKDNDKLGWVFVDKDTAKEGLILEKYYAIIEIPEDFSKDVTTLVEKNVVKPKLIYTVNEKKNAVAAKITDAGVKTVKNQLDENIVKVISGVMFRLCDEVGVDIQNNRSELRNIMNSVYKLDDNMPELGKLLDQAIDGTISTTDLLSKIGEVIPTVSDTLDGTSDFLNTTQNYIDTTQEDLNNESPKIKDDLIEAENFLDTSSVELQSIDEKILPEVQKKALLQVLDSAKATKTSVKDARSRLKDIKKFMDRVSKIDMPKAEIDKSLQSLEEVAKVQEALDSGYKLLKNSQDALKDESSSISKVIERLNTIDDKLGVLIDRVNDDIEKVDNYQGVNTQALKDIRKVLDDAHTSVANIADDYDAKIVPIINKGLDESRKISDNSLTLTAQGKNTLPEVQDLLNTFRNTADLSNEELNKLKEKFPDIESDVHELAERFKKIDNEEDIDELLDMITNNWDTQSDFLASPVEIEDNRLFPWPNYGSTVTPFYTVLCLWIGGYMLSVLIGTETRPLEEGKELKAHELYFGRMLLFLFMGIGQAIIASCGALFILHSYAVHPLMFVLYSIFVSIVFNIIIYTAVSIFGYGGIIFGIVVLVVQVAGTSGNFPIEVNPAGFQRMYPFLPFTYAINGIRQIMAGIVYKILFKDSAILCLYTTLSITAGILFKEAINKKRAAIVEKLKESSIMGS
jgi:putative membrane protein